MPDFLLSNDFYAEPVRVPSHRRHLAALYARFTEIASHKSDAGIPLH